MIHPCSTPVPFETLVAFWAGDMGADDADRLEEHLMGCGACSHASERVAAIASAVRSITPPFVSEADVADLRLRGLRVRDNPMSPGERKIAVFPQDLDFLVHRLGGLDLEGIERVRLTLRVEETGDVLLDELAPFNREAGEVLIACQRHFAAFPHNIVAEVRTSDAPAASPVAVYWIPHVFEGISGV